MLSVCVGTSWTVEIASDCTNAIHGKDWIHKLLKFLHIRYKSCPQFFYFQATALQKKSACLARSPVALQKKTACFSRHSVTQLSNCYHGIAKLNNRLSIGHFQGTLV